MSSDMLGSKPSGVILDETLISTKIHRGIGTCIHCSTRPASILYKGNPCCSACAYELIDASLSETGQWAHLDSETNIHYLHYLPSNDTDNACCGLEKPDDSTWIAVLDIPGDPKKCGRCEILRLCHRTKSLKK